MGWWSISQVHQYKVQFHLQELSSYIWRCVPNCSIFLPVRNCQSKPQTTKNKIRTWLWYRLKIFKRWTHNWHKPSPNGKEPRLNQPLLQNRFLINWNCSFLWYKIVLKILFEIIFQKIQANQQNILY